MQIIVNPADGFELSEALSRHIHNEVNNRLGRRFESWLTRVEVFMRDINGPKGGIDKHCRLEARPRGTDPVHVENQDVDAYACIKAAAEKLEKALDHKAGKLASR